MVPSEPHPTWKRMVSASLPGIALLLHILSWKGLCQIFSLNGPRYFLSG